MGRSGFRERMEAQFGTQGSIWSISVIWSTTCRRPETRLPETINRPVWKRRRTGSKTIAAGSSRNSAAALSRGHPLRGGCVSLKLVQRALWSRRYFDPSSSELELRQARGTYRGHISFSGSRWGTSGGPSARVANLFRAAAIFRTQHKETQGCFPPIELRQDTDCNRLP